MLSSHRIRNLVDDSEKDSRHLLNCFSSAEVVVLTLFGLIRLPLDDFSQV
jgi:hypothetical protein